MTVELLLLILLAALLGWKLGELTYCLAAIAWLAWYERRLRRRCRR